MKQTLVANSTAFCLTILQGLVTLDLRSEGTGTDTSVTRDCEAGVAHETRSEPLPSQRPWLYD